MCKICSHPNREQIEQLLLMISPDGSGVTLSEIAERFGVSVMELKQHALLHVPTVEHVENKSIAVQLKCREADILAEVAEEYIRTLKNVGKRINRFAASTDEDDIRFEKLLTKPVADMYINLGAEIRQTVRTLTEIDHMVNGSKDTAHNGLTALAAAIERSKPSMGIN